MNPPVTRADCITRAGQLINGAHEGLAAGEKLAVVMPIFDLAIDLARAYIEIAAYLP